MSPYRSYTLGTNPPFVYVPSAVMVVPVTRHEVGRSIEEDGPLLPLAFIWLSDSTEIGIREADAAPTARGVPVAGPVLAVVGTGAVSAGRDACRLAGPQPATRRVPMAAAAKSVERMLAISGTGSEIVMGRAPHSRGQSPAPRRIGALRPVGLYDPVGQMCDPRGIDNPHQVDFDAAGVQTFQQRTPRPSTTGTRLITSSSSRPARMHC